MNDLEKQLIEKYKQFRRDLLKEAAVYEKRIKAVEELANSRIILEETWEKDAPFKNMGVTYALQIYFRGVKEPKSRQEIIQALLKGGVRHKAKNLAYTIYPTLSRLARRGEIRRLPDGYFAPNCFSDTPNERGGIANATMGQEGIDRREPGR